MIDIKDCFKIASSNPTKIAQTVNAMTKKL